MNTDGGNGSRRLSAGTARVIPRCIIAALFVLRVVLEPELKARTAAVSESVGGGSGGGSLFVDYRIHPGHRATIGTEPWACGVYGAGGPPRLPLADEMRPHFNFSTTVRTNMKVLIMGDSVGWQFFEYLEKILLESSQGNASSVDIGQVKDLRRLPLVRVSSPLVDWRGAVGGYRVTGLFLPDAVTWTTPNWNRGWRLEHVDDARHHLRSTTTTRSMTTATMAMEMGINLMDEDRNRTRNVTLATGPFIPGTKLRSMEPNDVSADEAGDFDAIIIRVPAPGWTELEKVTAENLRTTVELAHSIFGVHVVVLVSLHYCNNAVTREMRDELDRRNVLLFEWARKYTETRGDGDGVRAVYVLDHGGLSDSLMEWNARLLGYDTRAESRNYTDAKLVGPVEHWKKTVAHVCGERVPANSTECVLNAVTSDGMHPCMNVIGPRFVAGLACQLQCAVGASPSWSCAEECNRRFMNVRGVA